MFSDDSSKLYENPFELRAFIATRILYVTCCGVILYRRINALQLQIPRITIRYLTVLARLTLSSSLISTALSSL